MPELVMCYLSVRDAGNGPWYCWTAVFSGISPWLLSKFICSNRDPQTAVKSLGEMVERVLFYHSDEFHRG